MYEKELEFCLNLIPLFNEYITKIPNEVENKSEFDLVTNLDKEIEIEITKKIKENFIGDSIIAEEFKSNEKILKRTWTIDPIDGTVNFVHKIQMYGLQMALIENDEVVFSFIYLPTLNYTLYAKKGEGSYLNGKRFTHPNSKKLSDMVLGFGDYTHRFPELSDMQLKVTDYFRNKVAKIKIFGSACIDYSYCALGGYNAYIAYTDNLWDILPGYFICKEAGLKVTTLDGTPYKIGDLGVVVSDNDEFLSEAINIMKKC